MGNDQSTTQQLKQRGDQPPTLQIMRSALRLKTHNGQYTKSFVNSRFAINLSRTDTGQLSRHVNPFVIVQLKFDDPTKPILWSTGCMISPLMVMSFPKMVGAQSGGGAFQLKVKGLTKQKQIQSSIEKVLKVPIDKEVQIAILVLSKPIWQFGWVGIRFLEDPKDIKNIIVKTVNHPQRQPIKQKKQKYKYKQFIKRIIPVYQQGSYKALHKDRVGSFIYIIKQKKPYILGVQISEEEIVYLNGQNFKEIKNQVKQYLTLEVEKQALKSIDLLGAEMQIQW